MSSPYVHPNALCELPVERIGRGTRIWAFAHILPGAKLGADCNICDHVFVENDVEIGDRVTVKSGVQLWDGVRVEDDVFIGPNATFTNDRFPRSKSPPPEFLKTVLRKGCSIGANATILAGLEIGGNAMVGAGAVVTNTVPPNAIVVGNPARIVGYAGADAGRQSGRERNIGSHDVSSTPIGIGACTLHTLKTVRDMRGDLSVAEFARDIPFAAKRVFFVYNVPTRDVRGEHAHRVCSQFLICVRGSCMVLLDDGHQRQDVRLDSPQAGIHIPPMIWGSQYRYSQDALLAVFASEYYDPADYIRSYDQFLIETRK